MLRSTHNRRVDTTARYLWETVRAQPVRNTFRLSVRRAPDESCETALERAEWQALYASHWATTQVPSMPPTLHEAVRWIAQLGGFLGRRSDGEPGVKTLWLGLRRLSDLPTMWQLHPPDTAPPLSTSG